MGPPEATPDAHLRRELIKALAIVFGGTFLLAIIQWVLPFTAGFMQVGLALLLLEVPLRLLPDLRAAPLWTRIGPIGRGLRLGGLTILVVFPLFVGGFHLVYTTVLDRPVDWDLHRLARWSEDLEFAPAAACTRREVSVWTQEGQLWVASPADAQLVVRLAVPASPPPSGDGPARPPPARHVLCKPTSTAADASPAAPSPSTPLPVVGKPILPDSDGTYRPPRGQGVFFSLGEIDRFTLHLADQRGPIAAERLRLGHRSVPASDAGLVEDTRSYWWLLAYLLIHLGLVAYPEEYFFRGYLQPRLDQRFGTPVRLLGVPVGRGLLLSALAFALLHPILIPGPHRLLVFFPALLFGWLAARQKELGAAILVHALSNVLLAVVSRMYG